MTQVDRRNNRAPSLRKLRLERVRKRGFSREAGGSGLARRLARFESMRPGSDIRRPRSRSGLWLLGGLFVAVLSSASPARAAGPSAPDAAEVIRLESECARLRTELARANADVAALKRADRGVRNDYRLRQRLADAEALARKLTEAEARLRSRQGPPPAPRAPALAPPSAQPGDGPVELEAKADLLSDQARRLAAEAEGLARTAGQLRGRQVLRRRAFQLERDPFAGLDGSKRTMVFGAPRTGTKAAADPTAPGGNNPQPTTGGAMDNATPGAAGGSSGPTQGGAPPAQPPTAAPPPTTTTPPPRSSNEGALAAGPAPQPTSALSTQLRALLDPSTLSEVRRLEQTGKPITDPEALEKLAAALRQRAQALDGQAKDLRAKARP
jgi:hypothetical protein